MTRVSRISYTAGDVVLLRDRESGMEWPALVTGVTRGGRPRLVWQRRERRGDGHLTSERTVDPLRVEILGPAPEADAHHLRRLAQ